MNNFTGSMCNAAPSGAVSLKKKRFEGTAENI